MILNSVKMETAIKAVRSLLFEWEEEGSEPFYYLGGTGFFVEYERSIFFITAQHCLRDGSRDVERLRVLLVENCIDFAPINAFGTIAPADGDYYGASYADLFIARVDLRLVEDLNPREVFPFQIFEQSLVLPTNEKIRGFEVRGYPEELKRIEHALAPDGMNKIVQRAFHTQGRNALRAIDRQHCYYLELDSDDRVPDTNGMSGSPVFARMETPDGVEVALLAGVLIGRTTVLGVATDRFLIAGPEVVQSLIQNFTRDLEGT